MNLGFKRKSEELNALHARWAEEDHDQMKADVRELMKTPAFRRFVTAIVKKGRVFGDINDDGENTHATFRDIGYRKLAVEIYMIVNGASPEEMFKAITERNEIERHRRDEYDAVLSNENER